MAFESWMAYQEFRRYTLRSARHVRDEAQGRFIAEVVASANERCVVWPTGKTLWRAQHCERNEQGKFLKQPPQRMKPLPYKAKEGRANPKGIPCLYAATDAYTALAEMRGWQSAYLSLATLSTTRDLTLVDCSIKKHEDWNSEVDALPEDAQGMVWLEINEAFSEPVTSDDSTSEYAPTQAIAEALKVAKFDGLIYSSAVGTDSEFNVALFDLNAADINKHDGYWSIQRVRVERITYEFGPQGD